MILIDYNQIALAAISHFHDELKAADIEKARGICRHAIIASLLSYKKKFKRDYGNLVITADYGDYWRKDIFPNYKAGRKKNRESSDLPWDKIFECLNSTREEIKEFFPWKVVHVPRCEADDVIAILCYYMQENEFSVNGIFDEPQSSVIVASDGDDVQLTKLENIRQWCPLKKSFIPQLSKTDLKKYIIDHVIKGDTSDGVPNIFMHEDFFVNRKEGERQKPVTQKILDLFFEHGEGALNMLPYDKKETPEGYAVMVKEVERRYHQNSKLVLFDNIPEQYRKDIVEHYIQPTTGSVDKVRKYFIKNRCNLLMQELDSI